MENIVFDYEGLELDFRILGDRRIRLLRYGRKGYLTDCSNSLSLSKFVEIGAVGFDHEGHHGAKHSGSHFGERALYVSHEISDTPKGKELVIVTEDGFFRAFTHFLAYKSGNSFSVYNEVENISSEPQFIEYVSSLYLFGFDEKENAKNLALAYANNGWHLEAQWNSFSFEELGIFTDNEMVNPKRWHIGNVGSWSSKEYLPMLAVNYPKGSLLIQEESNGSWNFEIGGEGKGRYIFVSGPSLTDSSWLKKVEINEKIAGNSATVSFGDDFDGALESLTKARRIMRRDQEDFHALPVIFNSYMHALWDLQTESTLKPLIDSAAKAGATTFCIDAGWFAKDSDWWNAIGDWEEEKENFPHGGLTYTLDYIRSKGLKAGLWIEIENVGEKSKLWKSTPKNWYLSIKGKPVFEHERHCLNFANPEVYAWGIKTLDRLISLYRLDYLKCDYNLDAGVGSDYEANSLGDGLQKHCQALLRFYDEIEAKYPTLTIENCASGGARMDYETLKHFPIQSTSDQTDYRQYPYIAGNVLTACPPDQAAVWSYPVDSTKKLKDITDEDVAMNMVNAILGRMHLASFIDKLPERQFSLIQEGVKASEKIAELKGRAWPVFPKGLAHFGDSSVVAGIKDGQTMILAIWNTSGNPQQIAVGLEKYSPKSVKVLYPTSLETGYSFDEKKALLTFNSKVGYQGRAFILKL